MEEFNEIGGVRITYDFDEMEKFQYNLVNSPLVFCQNGLTLEELLRP